MLLSVRWLNRIFPSGPSVGELADLLIQAGLEVEQAFDLGMGSGKIVVAKVLEVRRHPGADRLHLVKADLGRDEPARIVCGANNLHDGMLVPCAVPGAELPGGVKIKKSKIRGEPSEGMLCSARELNFGSDHDGILELPENFEVGQPFDYILDVKITPNRPDCLSVFGVAREVAAMMGKKVSLPPVAVPESDVGIDGHLRLEIEAPEGCPRYTCRFIEGVAVGPAPLWMRRALEASGQRSVNNVVDVTNYALLELGHPLHAFDFDTLRGGKIVVRYARAGEKIVTLDDRELELHPEDLVIADAERPIALAGVMGGRDTQVTDSTRNLALESAYFDPVTIRRTARRHGIQTESSYRFERGTDREGLPRSLDRMAQLILEVAGGEAAKGMLDVNQPLGRGERQPIELQIDRLNALLGLKLSGDEVTERLTLLGFKTQESGPKSLMVTGPSYRVDIEREVDLAEEVARMVRYDNIPETIPAIVAKDDGDQAAGQNLVSRARDAMVSLGFNETVHLSIVADQSAARHGFDPAAQPRLANPLTTDQTIMRPSLLPELLGTTGYNQRQGADRIALFEIGATFKPGARAGHAEDENLKLAIVLHGTPAEHWSRETHGYDFYDLKGVLKTWGETLGLGDMALKATEPGPVYHPGRSATICWKGQDAGTMGEVHPELSAAYDLKGRVHAAELDLDLLLGVILKTRDRLKPIPRFPSSQRDLALIVEESVRAEQLVQAARKAGRPLLDDLSVVDLYRGESIGEGKKSLALRFRLRKAEGTLTDQEINQVMDNILKALESQCGATLRS